jgi:inhibitor of cysteine peptidase
MMRGTIVALACVVWLAGCGGEDLNDPVQLTEGQSGQTIGVRLGQEVVVTLESNPTTGFGWSHRATPEDVLALVGEPQYVADQPVLPGSGGRQQFRFSTQRSGGVTLQFEYRRSWETVAPARAATFSLVVG